MREAPPSIQTTLDITIPYWGDPDLLIEAVESVLAQSDPSWTLFVIDDAYPDPRAAAFVTSLDDSRVEYRRNNTNQGISRAFQACIDHGSSPLVTVMGCDDILQPDYVAVILATHAKHPDAVIIQPGVDVIDERGNSVLPLADRVKSWLRPRAQTLLAGEQLAASLLRGNWLYWPSLAIRRDHLVGVRFRDDLAVDLDLALVIDIVINGGSLVISPTRCFSYRRHSLSVSSQDLMNGSRFSEDRSYFQESVERMGTLGWGRATRAARLRLTSRLHSLSLVPAAIRARDRKTLVMLLRHTLGS